MVGFVAGVTALYRPVRWLPISRRRTAALILAGGVMSALLGAAIDDPPAATAQSEANAASATTSPNPGIAPTTLPADTDSATTPATSGSPTTGPPPTPTTAVSTTTDLGDPASELTTVTRIIDGDTIVVSGEIRIRLIGVDTPEVDDDHCYATEATAFIASLIPAGTQVELVYDVERLDRFGRTLAYVYRAEDGLFVNAELMSQGYAQLLTIPPNVAHADLFVALQQEAREADLGLWSACPTSTGSPTTTAAAPITTRGEDCDPAYPTVCIPPPPPDLDCGEITYRDFTVLEPDPHRFDGNNDGVGCES